MIVLSFCFLLGMLSCFDGVEFKVIGKFFKDLVSSEVWVCFDEFNCMELEVIVVLVF